MIIGYRKPGKCAGRDRRAGAVFGADDGRIDRCALGQPRDATIHADSVARGRSPGAGRLREKEATVKEPEMAHTDSFDG
jgi:hypothetical protein